MCGQEGEVVCEVENMMGLVRERLALDKVLEKLASDLGWYKATGQQ